MKKLFKKTCKKIKRYLYLLSVIVDMSIKRPRISSVHVLGIKKWRGQEKAIIYLRSWDPIHMKWIPAQIVLDLEKQEIYGLGMYTTASLFDKMPTQSLASQEIMLLADFLRFVFNIPIFIINVFFESIEKKSCVSRNNFRLLTLLYRQLPPGLGETLAVSLKKMWKKDKEIEKKILKTKNYPKILERIK